MKTINAVSRSMRQMIVALSCAGLAGFATAEMIEVTQGVEVGLTDVNGEPCLVAKKKA